VALCGKWSEASARTTQQSVQEPSSPRSSDGADPFPEAPWQISTDARGSAAAIAVAQQAAIGAMICAISAIKTIGKNLCTRRRIVPLKKENSRKSAVSQPRHVVPDRWRAARCPPVTPLKCNDQLPEHSAANAKGVAAWCLVGSEIHAEHAEVLPDVSAI
jgi:hypothetical protein